jgi:hypothetical protein
MCYGCHVHSYLQVPDVVQHSCNIHAAAAAALLRFAAAEGSQLSSSRLATGAELRAPTCRNARDVPCSAALMLRCNQCQAMHSHVAYQNAGIKRTCPLLYAFAEHDAQHDEATRNMTA